MKKKTIMILGASRLQLPAIIKAKQKGYTVIAVDKDKSAIGFKEVDIALVFSTNDTEKVLEAAKAYKIDGIMTLASDFPMNTVAKVAQRLNLNSIDEETAKRTTNKFLMRKKLLESAIASPLFYQINHSSELLEKIGCFRDDEIIMKPADSSGSRGVFLIDSTVSAEELIAQYSECVSYSPSGKVIIEEYMQGPEVSVESISYNNKIYIIAVTDKITTGKPHYVEMGHSQPSRLPKDTLLEIKNIVIDAISSLGINIGPAHTELIVTREGPKIVEVGARLGGDFITTDLVPLSTGFDMVEAVIDICMGDSLVVNLKEVNAAAIRFIKTSEGKIKSLPEIKSNAKTKQIIKVEFTKEIGEKVSYIRSSHDRVGYVIGIGSNIDEAIKTCEEHVIQVTNDILIEKE